MKTSTINKTMKSALCAFAMAGLTIATQAQTLLYQWTFNGGTGTPDVTAGGGTLSINTLTGTGSNLGYNSSAGPGISGANGALTVSGGGYNSGNTSVAIASDLSGLGTLSQISLGFWFNAGSSTLNQLPRLVQIASSSGFDFGGHGSTTLNGLGTSINYGNAAGTGDFQLQSGGGGASATYNTSPAAPSPAGSLWPGTPTLGLLADNTWYYELVTYDGTQTANNLITYVGTNPNSLSQYSVESANLGSIAFGSTATVMMGNDNNAAAPRALSSGSIANVEIWSGIEPVPEPATLTLLGVGSCVGIMAIRRRRS